MLKAKSTDIFHFFNFFFARAYAESQIYIKTDMKTDVTRGFIRSSADVCVCVCLCVCVCVCVCVYAIIW
jgi:hypothetical protein